MKENKKLVKASVCTRKEENDACCTKIEQDVHPNTNEPVQERKEFVDIDAREEKKLKPPFAIHLIWSIISLAFTCSLVSLQMYG